MATKHTMLGSVNLVRGLEPIVTHWGVRGSFVTSDNRIGGHTTCISIEYGNQILIIDGGSGLIDAGNYIMKEYVAAKKDFEITFLHSHMHKDHRDGLPSFTPFYLPNLNFTFIGGRHDDNNGRLWTVEENLREEVFNGPSFPVPWKVIAPRCTFRVFEPGDRFTIPCAIGGDIKVLVLPMYHPNIAYGFRIEIGGRVIAVTLDHEQQMDEKGNPTELDRNILLLWDEADLAVTEVQYTVEKYLKCVGWGHISIGSAARHARLARPKEISFTHHDPNAGFDEVSFNRAQLQERSGITTNFAFQGNTITVC
ncbi:MAG: MBL fold metallo-hydrolase [Patescibacteria group bacterium]